MTDPMSDMEQGVGKLFKKIDKGLGMPRKALAGIDRGFRRVGTGIAVGTAVAAVGLASVVEDGAEFEQSLVNAASKFPDAIDRATKDGAKRFERISGVAQQIGADTEFTATEAAGGFDFLAKAGEKSEVAIRSLGMMVDFASSTEVDLARGTDIASDALGALGLATEDTEQRVKNYDRMLNLMSHTTNAANMTIDDLFDTVTRGAKPFLGAGQSIETFMASAQLLHGSGIKGAMAGRHLKIVMKNLIATSGEAATAMKGLRFNAIDKSTGKVRGLSVMMDELGVKLDKLKPGKRAQVMTKLFGEAAVAGQILLEAGGDNIRKLEAATEADKDAVARLAKQKRDTTLGDIKQMESALAGLKLDVFLAIKDDVRDVTQEITEWIRLHKEEFKTEIGDSLKYVHDNWETITATVGKFVRVGLTVWAVVKILQAFALVMSIVNMVMAANPIGLMIIGVVALTAAVVAAIVFWEELVGWFSELDGWVKVLIATFLPFVGLPLLIAENWEPIKAFFGNLWDSVVGAFTSAMGIIEEKINDTKAWINETLGHEVFDVAEVEQKVNVVNGDNSTTPTAVDSVSRTLHVVETVGDVAAPDLPLASELPESVSTIEDVEVSMSFEVPDLPPAIGVVDTAALPANDAAEDALSSVRLPDFVDVSGPAANDVAQSFERMERVEHLTSETLPGAAALPEAPGLAQAIESLERATTDDATSVQVQLAEAQDRPNPYVGDGSQSVPPPPRESQRRPTKDTLEITLNDRSGDAKVTGGTMQGNVVTKRTGTF